MGVVGMQVGAVENKPHAVVVDTVRGIRHALTEH